MNKDEFVKTVNLNYPVAIVGRTLERVEELLSYIDIIVNRIPSMYFADLKDYIENTSADVFLVNDLYALYEFSPDRIWIYNPYVDTLERLIDIDGVSDMLEYMDPAEIMMNDERFCSY